jgi:rhamnosyltransferase
MPSIAVVLAAYNGSAWIQEQVASIFAQEGVDATLFVSVDVSSDGTESIVDSLASANRRIVVLPHGERFGGAAPNFYRLIKEVDFSCFDFIALTDQDDIWQPEKLSRAVKVIQSNNVDTYSSNVIAFWSNGKQKLIDKSQPKREFDYMFESAGPGCTFVMTKKLALALQQFLRENQEQCSQVSLHDWLIYAFARSRGYKWFIDPESHMLYRQHASNVVGANLGIKAKLARWKKLREGWFLDQALIIANLLGYTEAQPMRRIKRLNLIDRIWLIVNAGKLRRHLRDRFALILFLLLHSKKD